MGDTAECLSFTRGHERVAVSVTVDVGRYHIGPGVILSWDTHFDRPNEQLDGPWTIAVMDLALRSEHRTPTRKRRGPWRCTKSNVR